MELRKGQDPDRAIQELRHIQTEFLNAVNGGHQGAGAISAYLLVIEAAEPILNSLFITDAWRTQLLSDRYWRIHDADAGTPRLAPLIRAETDYQGAWLEEYVVRLEEMAREDDAADPAAVRAVLDTNVHLHFKPFTDIDWPSELGESSVRLIVPLVVVQELDNLKNRGGKPAKRAVARLKAMQEHLNGKGRGPVSVRDRVTLEVLLSPKGHIPHPSNDEEILARAELFEGRLGGPLVLITGDYSMKLRAEARGLRSVELREDLRLMPFSVAATP